MNNQITKEIKLLEETIKKIKNNQESIEEIRHYEPSPLWPNGVSWIIYKTEVV